MYIKLATLPKKGFNQLLGRNNLLFLQYYLMIGISNRPKNTINLILS